jgi:hypothetical protein
LADVVDKALATLTPDILGESVEELLAGAQEELDRAATEARRLPGNVEPQMLTIVGLLAAVIVGAYENAGRVVEVDDEAAGEIRDATALVGNEVSHEVEGRLTYPYIHAALLDLHRRSGRQTRLEDNGSAVELFKGAAYLAGVIVHAIASGRVGLLVAQA